MASHRATCGKAEDDRIGPKVSVIANFFLEAECRMGLNEIHFLPHFREKKNPFQ